MLLVRETELRQFCDWRDLQDRTDLGLIITHSWPREITWSVITEGIRGAFPKLKSLLLIVRDQDMASVNLGPVEIVVEGVSLSVR